MGEDNAFVATKDNEYPQLVGFIVYQNWHKLRVTCRPFGVDDAQGWVSTGGEGSTGGTSIHA